ncbi:hypothetical protein GCM10022419_126030 [Nonomuraea rosea]|uniref:Uncharacterized protein n=1 Tax=Nonomuraea rosea TaxID=638574 RepID=A0ABP6ZT97_9ACTN
MGFVRAKTTGFNAILPTRDDPWKALVLRGDQAAFINQGGLLSEGPLLQSYGGQLAGIPEPFASCSDAAFEVRVTAYPRRAIFVAGDLCLDWVWGVGAKYQGPISSHPEFGRHIPPAYLSDIDTVMGLPNVPYRTMLFKGDRCAIIEWGDKGRGCYYEGPLTGLNEQGWKKLPADMKGGFDHAALLQAPNVYYQTLLVKGDRALFLDWGTGPKVVGSYAEVAAGLGALPADYRKPRLPAAGRFSGIADDVRLDLRVDLEGTLPVVSGDLFTVSDGSYYNSFVLDADQAVTLPATVTGIAKYAVTTGRTLVSVEVDTLAPGGTATLTRSAPDGTNLTTFTCSYVSRFLRTIDFEIDYVAGTEPVTQYATTDHPRPPGLAKRIMTAQAAFADAGVELRTAGIPNEVSLEGAGANLQWSDAELHAAMVSQFSLHRDTQQWKLWGFIANRYGEADEVSTTDGIMFDYLGESFQRQGLAIFYDTAKRFGYTGKREGLFSWTHEIGHALNLLHSWQKDPPELLGPLEGHGDLSFMNYADEYWGGPDGQDGDREAAFYNAFTWTFTAAELRHIRHGFYRHIVMGGDAWSTNSAHKGALAQNTPAPSESGLRLEVSSKDVFSHGEPVTAEIKLSLDGSTPTAQATAGLKPGGDRLVLLVTDPAGHTGPFTPVARACGASRRVTLDAGTPALYHSAYIGFGAGGFTFDQPGTYTLQARYHAPDGSTVTSPDHVVQISPPADENDKAAGDLLMGDQQGMLLALLGSDAPQLSDGNAALDRLIADHPDHPLAVYALMAKGTNAGRHFLTLTENGVEVRTADTDTSIEQLGTVVETTLDPTIDAGVDNITLNETMRRLARAHARAGDLKQADVVLDQLVDTFRDKDVPPPVLATIVEQAETIRAQLHPQAAPPQ